MQDLAWHFNQFVENISIGEPQVSRMESAADNIIAFLKDQYGLADGDVFLQGSYPNGTAVEPVNDGEYDVDIVAICVDRTTSCDDALNELETRFKANGNFKDRVKRKQPCVRLEYAPDDVGKFHVDVVPVRPSGVTHPPLEAPRRGDDWHGTAPQEYTDWCVTQGEAFMRNVKIMKRWRAEQQTEKAAIKSIVLQVLVSHFMPRGVADDQERVISTFRAMHQGLKGMDSPPVVKNPVLTTENLAKRWSKDDFASFIKELDQAVRISAEAANAEDPIEAADKWRELLGEDFPADTPQALGLRLSDTSHAKEPADMGWTRDLDPRYGVSVTTYKSRRGMLRRIDREDHLFFAGNHIKFKAHVRAPNHVEVWWQVVNTGKHARDVGGLRGGIFKGRDLKNNELDDETVNWESTSYTGTHLVRALLVRNYTVVAESPYRRINIYAKRHRFEL